MPASMRAQRSRHKDQGTPTLTTSTSAAPKLSFKIQPTAALTRPLKISIVDRPPSAVSSSAASTSTSSSSGGGRRFLGLGKDTREREPQSIRDAERTAPARRSYWLSTQLSRTRTISSTTTCGQLVVHPNAYTGVGATAHSERRFSFTQFTPPPSSSGHSSDYGHGQTLQLAW
ncbi:hypothetical protein C8R44DRAFT_893946 [Mycena epipterygia]|nr:hypothetical protein C8R44DRAFT_893946 [Mycena epipterygia]